jgi:hypothetical protein
MPHKPLRDDIKSMTNYLISSPNCISKKFGGQFSFKIITTEIGDLLFGFT